MARRSIPSWTSHGASSLFLFWSLLLSVSLRGVEGTRNVLLINPEEMHRAGLQEGQIVSLISDAEDGIYREVGGLKITPFFLPDGCVGSYYPEMNPLIWLWYHDEASQTPGSKDVPVRTRA